MFGRVMGAAALIAAIVTQAEAASLVGATNGHTYFNRPGADLASHDAALASCMGLAAQMTATDLVGAGMILEMAKAGTTGANIENCMVVRGWRVMRLSDAKEVSDLKQPQLRERLAQWVGAVSPPGDVTRAWANEALFASTQRTGPAQLLRSGYSLSVAAFPDEALKAIKEVKPFKTVRYPKEALPPKRLKFEELASIAPDKALLIVDLRDTRRMNAVSFRRQGADPNAPAWVDGKVDAVWLAGVQTTFKTEGGALLAAFSVPPGRWMLATLHGTYSALSFCMGAPGFDVAAGDVVFAGRFSFATPEFGPDMDLSDSRAMLASMPGLAAKLKGAAYINGNRGHCEGQNLYALDVKGAPYAPGYEWAGASRSVP